MSNIVQKVLDGDGLQKMKGIEISCGMCYPCPDLGDIRADIYYNESDDPYVSGRLGDIANLAGIFGEFRVSFPSGLRVWKVKIYLISKGIDIRDLDVVGHI